MVEEAKEEGFPVDVEEKEAYFMNEVARGEQLAQDGKNSTLEIRITHVWVEMPPDITKRALHYRQIYNVLY